MALPKTLEWINRSYSHHGYIPSYSGTGTPHYAVDVATPMHSEIGALWGGTVTSMGYQPWGGEIFIKMNNGTTYYMYHLDNIYVKRGQRVQQGDVLGLSGGANTLQRNQYPSAQRLNDPRYSTGPHTHIGFFERWTSTPNGTIPYGPDITPYIQALRGGRDIEAGTPLRSLGMSQTAKNIVEKVQLKPNDDVERVLESLDVVAIIDNPFIVDNASIADPLGWFQSFGTNLWDDAVASIFRAILIAIGVLIIWRIVSQFFDTRALVGSVAGAVGGVPGQLMKRIL